MEERVAAIVHLWRRPVPTQKLIHRLGTLDLSALYVNADGPREGNSEDVALCDDVRQLIRSFSPEYPVYANFSQEHRGLRRSIIEGSSWFFENEAEGVVLEEDTHPTELFLVFAAELLAKYRHNHQVAQISGTNHALGAPSLESDYYYSRFQHIWGFATWADRWKGFPEFATSGKIARSEIERAFPEMPPSFHSHWVRRVNRELTGESDTWSASWNMFSALRGRLSVAPSESLVANVGFGPAATNAKRIPLVAGGPPTPAPLNVTFSFRGPDNLVPDGPRDYYVGMTQWPTQSGLLRGILAAAEWWRRIIESVASSANARSRTASSHRSGKLTVAQLYFRKRAFDSSTQGPG